MGRIKKMRHAFYGKKLPQQQQQPLLLLKTDVNFSQTKAKQAVILRNLNIAAFALHLASFIAALIVSIVFSASSFQAEITTDFRGYNVNATGPANAGPFSSTLVSKSFYPLIWVNLPFPLITALFHGFIAFVPFIFKSYTDNVLTENNDAASNPLRWFEYAITASLMTWVIMQLSGITNIFILLMLGIFGNIVLQFQGYLQEKTMAISRMPTLTGWLLFLAQWITIFSYFFTAITSERPANVATVPWFVYSIIIGLFFLFSTFGLIQLARVFKFPKFMVTGYAQEIAYIVMSLTAKLFLTWNLLIGIAINPIE